jgi:O-antigen/teichoic acid export membrane protein
MKSDSSSKKIFDTSHLKKDLKNRSIRGTFMFVGARGLNTLIQIGSTIILARLITPKDYGLVAMVFVGLDLLMNFRDAGLSTATVQRKNINQAQISTLFWINTLLGLLLATIMSFLAPAFAWFYQEPKLRAITLSIAIIFIFDGLTVQHRALLQRQMHYHKLAFIQIFSQTSGKIAAIVMASQGFGYWSLVAMPVSTSFFRLTLAWFFSNWVPSFPKKAKNIRDMLAFGMHLTGANFISFFSQQLDNILIGRFCGPVLLGLYSKSYNLVSMPSKFIAWPMDDVLIPSLSVLQDSPEKYRLFFRRALEKLNFFGQPITVFLIVAAEEVILVLLGNQWKEAIPIFRRLGLWGFCMITQTGGYIILISLNKTGRLLKWEFYKTIIQIIAVIFGLHWGAIGIATAIFLSCLLLKIPEMLYCYRETPISIIDFWEITWRTMVSSIGAGILLYFIRKTFLMNICNVYLRLPIIIILFSLMYIGFFATLPNGPEKLKDIITKVMSLTRKKSAS